MQNQQLYFNVQKSSLQRNRQFIVPNIKSHSNSQRRILQTEFQTHFHIEKWSLSLNQHDIFNPGKRQLKFKDTSQSIKGLISFQPTSNQFNLFVKSLYLAKQLCVFPRTLRTYLGVHNICYCSGCHSFHSYKLNSCFHCNSSLIHVSLEWTLQSERPCSFSNACCQCSCSVSILKTIYCLFLAGNNF